MGTSIAPAIGNAFLSSILNGASFTSYGPLYVEFHLGDPGPNGTALPAANTVRQSTGSMTSASGGSSSNTALISWSSVPMSETYSDVSMWSASSGGTFILSGTVTAGPVSVGDTAQVAVGGLVVSIPIAGVSTTGVAAATANAFLNAILAGTAFTPVGPLYVQMHVGQPGAAGTSNPAGNTVRQSTGAMSTPSNGSSSNTSQIGWTAVSTSETYSYVSLWTASSGGSFVASGSITAAAVTSGGNFAIPVNDLTISIPIAS